MNWIAMNWRWSRNGRESLAVTAKRFLWASLYFIKGVLVGVRGMISVKLGSKVRHDGRLWIISNWAGMPLMNLYECAKDGEYRKNVPSEDISPVVSMGELLYRFRFSYRWYMTSWHIIDVNKRLYPR